MFYAGMAERLGKRLQTAVRGFKSLSRLHQFEFDSSFILVRLIVSDLISSNLALQFNSAIGAMLKLPFHAYVLSYIKPSLQR